MVPVVEGGMVGYKPLVSTAPREPEPASCGICRRLGVRNAAAAVPPARLAASAAGVSPRRQQHDLGAPSWRECVERVGATIGVPLTRRAGRCAFSADASVGVCCIVFSDEPLAAVCADDEQVARRKRLAGRHGVMRWSVLEVSEVDPAANHVGYPKHR